jgi:hypothetical protein
VYGCNANDHQSAAVVFCMCCSTTAAFNSNWSDLFTCCSWVGCATRLFACVCTQAQVSACHQPWVVQPVLDLANSMASLLTIISSGLCSSHVQHVSEGRPAGICIMLPSAGVMLVMLLLADAAAGAGLCARGCWPDHIWNTLQQVLQAAQRCCPRGSYLILCQVM